VADEVNRIALGENAAFQLANVTKTAPQYGAITPRWLVRLLDWKPLEAGTFRVNRVDEGKAIESLCSQTEESEMVPTYVEYQEKPREYRLSSISAVLNVHTRISDIFSNPYDQVREQLRILIENVKEKQEGELLNNADYGLLNNVPASQKLKTRKGAPTPDDLDELLTKVWKEPSFFLAHPSAIAAFGRECTRRGVPPPTVTLFGTPFLTWRGIPLIPTNKIEVGTRAASPRSCWCALAKESKVSSASSSRGCPESRVPACRSASWGSTRELWPPTWLRCIAPPPCLPTMPLPCSKT
jgi:hypothetical protein